MDPLEQIQRVRQELQRLASEKLGAGASPPEMQQKLSQLHTALSRAEEQLRATLSRARPTKEELRAEGDKLVAEKMQRANEIKALRETHGAGWVFVPTAAERAAAAVAPIATVEVPGLIGSMFEQLKIRPGHETPSDTETDREIWEDLSQMESDSPTPARAKPTQTIKPPQDKPRKPAEKGDTDLWDDLANGRPLTGVLTAENA